MRSPAFYRAWTLIAIGGPVAILTASFVAIAIYTANPWPWFEIVHESGDRNLIQTILFFEHAARELPLDLILGAAAGAAALVVLPLGRVEQRSRSNRPWMLMMALASVIALILGGTLMAGGLDMLVENLLQFPTRPGAAPEWGGHWRYHLLSHVMLMGEALGLAAVVAVVANGRSARANRIGLRTFNYSAALFALLSVVFVPNLDPFVDPVVIGHQLRESFTHAIVTIPAAFGVGLLAGKPQWSAPEIASASLRGPFAAGVIAVLTGAFLLISGLARSVASQGQSESFAVLLFPHFFEHTFSYIVAGITAGLVVERGRTSDEGLSLAGVRRRSS